MEAIGENRVHSFDHVAINDKVTSCDMKAVPLADEALDVAVFSLSLMGKNWSDYIKEAKRCLATNGYLLIAETTKSMSGNARLSKLRNVIKEQGFEIYEEEERGDFTFIEARELERHITRSVLSFFFGAIDHYVLIPSAERIE
jgi:SAM-dependent methyltransferase